MQYGVLAMILFVIAKLAGWITLSWVWVITSIVWVPVGLFVAYMGIILGILILFIILAALGFGTAGVVTTLKKKIRSPKINPIKFQFKDDEEIK